MTVDQTQVVMILITLAVAGFALYQSYKRGEGITLSSAIETVRDSGTVAVELYGVAEVAVNAIEQMRREGKITDNNVAFREAMALMYKWVPAEWKVDEEDIVMAVNAAILLASAASKQAGVSSEHATH